jgi:hypothetical protein
VLRRHTLVEMQVHLGKKLRIDEQEARTTAFSNGRRHSPHSHRRR